MLVERAEVSHSSLLYTAVGSNPVLSQLCNVCSRGVVMVSDRKFAITFF